MDIAQKLDLHAQWLESHSQGERFNLEGSHRGLHLQDADLRNARISAKLDTVDLSGANLSSSDLSGSHFVDTMAYGVTLNAADLTGVDVFNSDLTEANLADAVLGGAILNDVDLSDADLTRADLSDASLIDTFLNNALMTNSYLKGAKFSNVSLSNANLEKALFSATILLRCPTLCEARGLTKAAFWGDSIIDSPTLRASISDLPDFFLKGVGYNDAEIETLRGLYGSSFRYYSCFISHASFDHEFADRLYSDLMSQGINCWKDSRDLKGGMLWQPQINEAIRLRDKTIIVCSETSLKRPQVVREIIEALSIQKASKLIKVFPIRIDDYIFNDEIVEFAKHQVETGEWPEDWVPRLRALHIPSFVGWQNHPTYKHALERLVADLKKRNKEAA